MVSSYRCVKCVLDKHRLLDREHLSAVWVITIQKKSHALNALKCIKNFHIHYYFFIYFVLLLLFKIRLHSYFWEFFMNWLLLHGDGKSALFLMIIISGIPCIQIWPVFWWMLIGCFCVTLCQVLDAPPPSGFTSLNTHLLGQGYTYILYRRLQRYWSLCALTIRRHSCLTHIGEYVSLTNRTDTKSSGEDLGAMDEQQVETEKRL